MRLKDKVAVITGAGSGMGRAMANLFAAEGAKLIVGEWNKDTLCEVIEEITAAGGTIIGLQGNIGERADAEMIVQAAIDTYGRIDVLVNNAGVMDQNEAVGDVDDETWERVLRVNLFGTMYLTRKAVNTMAEQGSGSIINIASIGGITGSVAGVSYTASKHGVVGLTRSTAYLYAQKGVRCNAILPGAVQTNIQQSMDVTKVDAWATERLNLSYGMIPAQLEADDIAKLALFLASDDAVHINGALISADAGWRA